ncbi:TPA: hypothetical protein UMB92_002721 [Stenotrophomonas maltophilia]|nr:hypothetical protein [Stenotrophomonas maltophilia]
MADINRRARASWALVPLALVALAACSEASDPAQTVQRDADAQYIPARPVSDAMPVQPAAPAEGVTQPEAVQLRRTDDGGIEIRKADAMAGQGVGTAPARAEPLP